MHSPHDVRPPQVAQSQGDTSTRRQQRLPVGGTARQPGPRYGDGSGSTTLNDNIMPASRCSAIWQCAIQRPGFDISTR